MTQKEILLNQIESSLKELKSLPFLADSQQIEDIDWELEQIINKFNKIKYEYNYRKIKKSTRT
jgi:hypothetical protein